MLKAIKAALGMYGLLLPAQVKAVLIDLGGEVDRLGSELDRLRNEVDQLKLQAKQ